MTKAHKLRVRTIERETSEAVSVGLEVPGELESKFDFIAGQYLTFEKEIAGDKLRRSYSICSSPNSGELKVAVKEIPNGRFSAWANNKLMVGDTLKVFPPEGRFVYKPLDSAKSKNYVAFAAGSGITPIMSILQNVLETEPESRFILVYGNRTPEQTMFYKSLLGLVKQYPDRFFIEFIYSRLGQKQSLFKLMAQRFFRRKSIEEKNEINDYLPGRIGRETIDYILRDKYKSWEFEAFYLCGPQDMTEMISNALKESEIAEEKIHFELFVTDTTENDEKLKNEVSGRTKVKAYLDFEEIEFEMDRKERILEAIRDEGLDPPYSCEGGTCSSCMAQIVEGDAKMANNQILSEAEIRDGLLLTCQAHPITDEIIIDFDDV